MTTDDERERKPPEERDEADTGKRDEADPDEGLEIDGERLITFLQWGALFGFALLILVSGAGLYGSLGSIIDVWVADRFQPIARAAVNLALLCVAIGGVAWASRRLER